MSSQSTDGYALSVAPVPQPVIAEHNGSLLAESRDAKVMFETRLPPTIYFPRGDVVVPLRENPTARTFCPFKGTARYFDAKIDGQWIERAAWHYPQPLTEAGNVDGCLAFASQISTKIDPEPRTLSGPVESPLSGPLVEWLMREASYCADAGELTRALGQKLNAHGVIVSRISTMIWSLHPLTAGQNHIWTRSDDELKTFTPGYQIHSHPAFVNSPMRHVSNGLGGVRQRLDGSEPEFNFSILEDLRKEGATDYVAMPLVFSGGQINVLTLTCDHPNGFTTANLGLVFELSAAISRYYEVFVLKENARSILETYVGSRTADRVLGGEIKRGDGDEIDAAILIADLRNSSSLEQTLGRKTYLDLLNAFFEECEGVITEQGGEVLKFIGDAVLAVFPAGEPDAETACKSAAEAACHIVRRLQEPLLEKEAIRADCAIGIAFGEVTYGNVGSASRLDFTVIGKATNIAARLSDYGKTCEQHVVVSREIADTKDEAVALGSLDLRNIDEQVEAFALVAD